MSRSTPPTPNLSAIEDRALEQAERLAKIRAEMAQEAREREIRRQMAESQSGLVGSTSAVFGKTFAEEANRVLRRASRSDDVENRKVNRDPCPYCATRSDVHDQFGCKRWRPR